MAWLAPKSNIKYTVEINKLMTQFKVGTFALLDRSPTFLPSDDFVRSNEIVGTKWLIYLKLKVISLLK